MAKEKDQKPAGGSDFNADDLIAKSDRHATDIADLSKRVTELESTKKLVDFKSEYEGTKLHDKIAEAIGKSKDVDNAIKIVVWDLIRTKFWIGLAAVIGLVLTDLLIRAIPNILDAISKK